MSKPKRRKDELALESECNSIARKKGIISVKLENNGHTGIPDRMYVSWFGEVFFVEYKTKVGVLSDEQIYWQGLLKNHFIVRSVEEFMNILIKLGL